MNTIHQVLTIIEDAFRDRLIDSTAYVTLHKQVCAIDTEWYDADGNVDPAGAFDAGSNLHAERLA